MNETVRRFCRWSISWSRYSANSEIVLHDFSDPDHAIVDIRNGIVSGRKVGGPATDLALTIMHDAKYRDLPFITGYEGRGAGGKTLESATYLSARITRSSACSASTPIFPRFAPSTPWLSSSWPASTLCQAGGARVYRGRKSSESTQELIDRSISELLSARGLDVASLGQSDRVDVIRHLNGNGVFMLKGAVACAAAALGISEPSVYRYLQKVRKEG